MSEKFFYKIKDNKTGLYFNGGRWSRSVAGKVWRNKQALGGHLALYSSYKKSAEEALSDADWTVEMYATEPVKSMSIQEYLKTRNEKQTKNPG